MSLIISITDEIENFYNDLPQKYLNNIFTFKAYKFYHSSHHEYDDDDLEVEVSYDGEDHHIALNFVDEVEQGKNPFLNFCTSKIFELSTFVYTHVRKNGSISIPFETTPEGKEKFKFDLLGESMGNIYLHAKLQKDLISKPEIKKAKI